MIVVAGATGNLGGAICRLLKANGESVRALVRSSSERDTVDGLKTMGIETAQGDLRDRSSLDALCKGATAVISTVSAMPARYLPGDNDLKTVDLQGLKNLIDAAKAAGVDHFIFTSFSPDNDFTFRNIKRQTEQHLENSDLAYTILRPSYFMEAWLSAAVGFDYENAQARIYGSGDNPISFISMEDVARFAMESLKSPAAKNATLVLGGPEALSPNQVVSIFEEISGTKFQVEYVPIEALQAQQNEAEDPMQEAFAGLMVCYAQGDAINMAGVLKDIPVKLTSVRDYTASVIA